MNKIPTGWHLQKLGDISRIYSGGTPSRSVSAYWGGNIPWASTAEIDSSLITSTKEKITKSGLASSGARIAPAGTLLMAMYGQGKTRGKTSILGIDAAMNQACAAIESGSEVDSEYLLYYLSANYEQIRALSNSGGQENLSGEIVKNIPILLPDIREQSQIAKTMTDVSLLIESLDSLIAKKQAIKQGMMQELLTGKTRLLGFSGRWIDARLAQIATVTMGQSPIGSSYNADGFGIPLIQGNADIRDRQSVDRLWTTAPTKRCAADDVLLTVRAPVGHTAIASRAACLGRGVCSLTAGISNRFLYHALVYAEPRWTDFEQGSTFTAINSTEVRAFTVPWPIESTERNGIAEMLDDADSSIRYLYSRLSKTKAIKQGMMQELLTGRTRLPYKEAAT